ncbi:acyl-CoA carboxylase epsilon subunit [Streptomyces tendae]|uniref:acyl-CoA carboxylase epsilon subunit n=1 Tax=Streptomyces tendae TaxID=1932 RepID=UPI0033D68C54
MPPPPFMDSAGTPGDGPPATDTGRAAEPFLRVEKGNPDEAELAALTAVLLARTGALPGPDGQDPDLGPERRTACWRRLERRSRPGTPRIWRDTVPRR